MINHTRTLLLNLTALPKGSIIPDYEEYIAPEFSTMTYSPVVTRVRNALVPVAPRLESCFKAYALLSIMQAPDFEPYVLTFDARLTYDVASARYISADSARSEYPVFGIMPAFNSVNAAIMNGGISIFDKCPAGYSADMQLFKDVWFGNNDMKSKLAAAALAAVYAMTAERQNAV